MRTHLAAFIALGLSCGAWSASQAGDRLSTPLPGPLGRVFGIGYSAGYHAHYPSRPSREQRLHGFTAPSHQPGIVLGPADCPQCAGSARPIPVPYAPHDATQFLQGEAPSAPSVPAPSQPIQQPPRATPSSDRASFLKRLPNMRGAASVPEAPAPSSPPTKGSVARSSVLEIEAR